MNTIANIKAIIYRELYSYFVSPVAYVFIIIFLLLMGFFTFMLGNFFQRNEASLDAFFLWHPWLYMFLVPSAGMRLWSEEQRSGTLELLFTLPTTVWQAVWGKFLAGCVFLGICLVLTFPIVITVKYLGNPDSGIIVCGYIGSYLIACTFLAVSELTSALTRNQVISFIISLVFCLLLILAGWPPVTNLFVKWAPVWLVDFVAAFSIIPHFEGLQRGVIDSRDIIYYLSVIVFTLFATGAVLRGRRLGA
jgi:ABC-2 type transport system permease protein